MTLTTPSSSPSFRIVDAQCQYFPNVVATFNDRIKPIYGSQDKALAKIGEGKDRLCEVLFDQDVPKALIVYKKQVNTDQVPSKKSLELKTLIVMNPEQDSGKGYGSILAKRVEQVAKDRLADGVFVTVSSEKPEALSFFKKKGFSTQNTFPDLYKKGSTEESLFLEIPYSIPRKRPALEASLLGENRPREEVRASSTSSSSERPYYRSSYHSSERPYYSSSYSSSARIQAPTERAASESKSAVSSSASSQERVHSSTLGRQYIQQIQARQKTYEGRINSGPFLAYNIGDKANWYAGDQQVETKIIDKRVFKTFRDMLENVGYKNMLPTARSLDDAVNEYNKIPGYSDRAARSGVVAFGLEVLPRTQGIKRSYENR